MGFGVLHDEWGLGCYLTSGGWGVVRRVGVGVLHDEWGLRCYMTSGGWGVT